MPTRAVVMVMMVVVNMPHRHQLHRAAIIALGPRPVDTLGPRPIRRIGIAWTGWFGTGRKTGQQDDRREESKPTHVWTWSASARRARKQATVQGNVIVRPGLSRRTPCPRHRP